jgi:hypothetical protein
LEALVRAISADIQQGQLTVEMQGHGLGSRY